VLAWPRLVVPTIASPWQQPVAVPVTDRSQLLAALMNPNLPPVRQEVDPATGEPRVLFRALIEVIYSELLARISGSVRRCASPDCGALFFPPDPRTRSCPPPLGVKESQCMKRCRTREWRLRNANKRSGGATS
jgi:hypothetical protein